MSKKSTLKPVIAALGTTFVVSLATSPITQAAENPFQLNELSSGYTIVAEGNCGEKGDEGKCGEKDESQTKDESEGKCGEGKCGN